MTRDATHGRGDCARLAALLSEYLDEELPEKTCESLEAHLGDCEPCRRFLDSLRTTVGWLRASPRPELPPGMREELDAALRAARAAERERREGSDG